MSKKVPSQLARCIGFLAIAQLAQYWGCGGADEMTTCALDAKISDAVEWQSAGDPACVIPFGGAQASLYFSPIGGDLESFHIEIRDLKEGQTGTFPASVEILMRDQRTWKTIDTGCALHIDSQIFVKEDEFRKQYVASGTGDCAVPAMPQGGASGTITVAPFSFTSSVNY